MAKNIYCFNTFLRKHRKNIFCKVKKEESGQNIFRWTLENVMQNSFSASGC